MIRKIFRMNRSQHLLQKYLNGHCTTEEKRQLYRDLLKSNAEDYDDVLQALWKELADALSPASSISDRLYRSIDQRIQPASARRISPVWYRQAAAALVGILLLVGVWYFLSSASMQVYQTQYGKVKTLTLPDSSVVYLNSNSKLSYSSNLAIDSVREVWLTGEAYFEVTHQQASTHDEAVKLVVHTEQVDIQVVGTAFNVKNRRGATQVVLDEGKVQLKKPVGDSTLLAMQPGESVQIDQQQAVVVQKITASDQVSSWKENELYFDNQTLEEIQLTLADNYGVRLRFADPELRTLRFTGSIPTDDLTPLFTALGKSFSLSITQDGDEYLVEQTSSE